MADKIVCWKCGGSGYLPQYSYFNHGVCYACHGTGYLTEQQ
jgi:DnaJ-class molecular chaperone